MLRFDSKRSKHEAGQAYFDRRNQGKGKTDHIIARTSPIMCHCGKGNFGSIAGYHDRWHGIIREKFHARQMKCLDDFIGTSGIEEYVPVTSLSSPWTRLHRPLESLKGSIGITLSTK